MKKMKIQDSNNKVDGEVLVLRNENSDTYFLGSAHDIKGHIVRVGTLKDFAEIIIKRGFNGTADYEVINGEIKFYSA